MPSALKYSRIKEEVKIFCVAYKREYALPTLPTNKDLASFQEIIVTNFQPIVVDIKHHFGKVNADVNNALEHSLWVAVRVGFIANNECQKRGLDLD